MAEIIPLKQLQKENHAFVIERILYDKNNFSIVQGVVGPNKDVHIGVRSSRGPTEFGKPSYIVFPKDFTEPLVDLLFKSEATGIDFTEVIRLINETSIDKYVPRR